MINECNSKKLSVPDVNSILLATVILNTIYPTIMHVKGGGGGSCLSLWKKRFLSKELELWKGRPGHVQ